MSVLLLDLFCGAGGAAVGYHRAGFEVVGVDIRDQPRYPFTFCEADALDMLDDLIGGHDPFGYRLSDFDAIHASPPCQRWSSISRCAPGLAEKYPALIEPVRDRLIQTGMRYVIENVPQSPLRSPVTICGSHFNLITVWKGEKFSLRRHRLFESNVPIPDPGPHDHSLYSIGVYGNGAGGGRPRKVKGPGFEQARRDVMGINWMTRDELNESIPPAYTEYIGRHLAAHCTMPVAA